MTSILICCAYFYPSYKSGGPVRSLCNLINTLDDSISIDVITKDRDMGDEEIYSNIEVDSWSNHYGKARVFYLSPKSNYISNLRKIFEKKKYGIIYLNSFFDIDFSIKFLFLTLFNAIKVDTIVIAPRGELTKGAMSLKSNKKRLYLLLFKALKLHKKVKFHFTSKDELRDALFFLGEIDYTLVPNMHENIPRYLLKDKEEGTLKVIFLSRVSPKKNLKTILKSLLEIKDGRIEFTIAGAIDDDCYWRSCELLIKKLPNNITVKYLGAINRKQVDYELKKSHLFFLPTLNENYGHAIVEAMVNSNIVLLSNQTPWSNVAQYGSYVGAVYDIHYFSNTLKELITMKYKDYNERTYLTYSYCKEILIENEKKIKHMFPPVSG